MHWGGIKFSSRFLERKHIYGGAEEEGSCEGWYLE
jgi:hypothetical protein